MEKTPSPDGGEVVETGCGTDSPELSSSSHCSGLFLSNSLLQEVSCRQLSPVDDQFATDRHSTVVKHGGQRFVQLGFNGIPAVCQPHDCRWTFHLGISALWSLGVVEALSVWGVTPGDDPADTEDQRLGCRVVLLRDLPQSRPAAVVHLDVIPETKGI
ncbi:hypothetical protein EYF80_003055 [Liparis tanakae]|uniref:Uncharacterized protein n=1 Tax=Liparis tanakae TaxID=230148 RepID=A0A4Z2J978_9TELE|nr:hypothetical protein EYF80_003055 [Liparis tanakae]